MFTFMTVSAIRHRHAHSWKSTVKRRAGHGARPTYGTLFRQHAGTLVATVWVAFLGAVLAGCGASSTAVTVLSGSGTGSTRVLQSIAVSPANATLAVGLSRNFIATGLYDDGTKADITSSVTWTSSAPGVATVSNAAATPGLGVAISVGSTTVTAALVTASATVSGTTTLTVVAPTLASISVSPANLSIAAGMTQQFTATGLYTDNSRQDVTASATWTTSNAAIATVTASGLATGVSVGSAAITATLNGVSGYSTLTVTAATLVSIAVTPPTANIGLGATQPLTAVGTLSDGSMQTLTTSVSWTSGTPAVATVSNTAGTQGQVMSVGQGTAVITATSGAVTGTATVTVTAATAVSVGVTPANISLAQGTHRQYVATAVYTDGTVHDVTANAQWTSSAVSVATIGNAMAGDSGLATAVAAGTTTIGATVATTTGGTASGSTTLTVTAATLVSISVTPSGPRIAVGTTRQLTATGIYSDGSHQDLTDAVTWSSSATSVATIGNTAGSYGLAAGLAAGTTTITANYAGIMGTDSLTVTSATLASIAVTPANASLPAGSTQQYVATGTYTDNSTQVLTTAVTWASSAPTIAGVGNTAGTQGVVTTLAQGTATIMASLNGVSGSTALTVTAATLTSLAVTPVTATAAAGTTQPFTAIGTYSDMSTLDLTTTVTWTSSSTTVATISNAPGSQGTATAAGVGATTITATLNGSSATATFTVTAATLVSITVTPMTVSVLDGSTQQFTATGTYSDGSTQNLTSAVTWTSSVPSIATISNAATNPVPGLATALYAGTTQISAALGTTPSNAATLTVVAQQYVYVANLGSTGAAGVAQYRVNADGTLMSLGSVSTQSGPFAVAFAPSGLYAYVINYFSDTVSQYNVNPDGTLTSMTTPTAATGHSPNSIAIDPTGRYAYVVDYDDGVMSNGTNPTGMISEFTFNATGGLVPAGTVPAGQHPATIALAANGYAYVTDYTGNTILEYAVGAGGALAPMAAPNASLATGNSPTDVLIDPSGAHVYVTNYAAHTVAQFTVGTTGALAAMGTPTVQTGNGPFAIALDGGTAGTYAYVANRSDGTVSAFNVSAAGVLTALTAQPSVTVGAGTGPNFLAVDLTQKYLYVTDRGTDNVTEFSIGASGALTLLGTVSAGPGGSKPTGISVLNR